MEKKTLKRVGENSWGHIVYQEETTGKFFLDINDGNGEPDMHTCHPSDDPEGEPGWPVKFQYEISNPITEIEKIERENKFNYMLLSRLQSDCDGFLSPRDCRYKDPNIIWGGNVADHIAKMKELWNAIPEVVKPQWISWEQILDYEKKMA